MFRFEIFKLKFKPIWYSAHLINMFYRTQVEVALEIVPDQTVPDKCDL